MLPATRYPLPKNKIRGLSLVELLVALIISLVIAGIISNLVIFGERHKRQLTSVNDMEIGANYTLVQLDAMLRSAGSGYLQSGLLGCYLAAGNGAAAILPRTAAWPTPFEKVLEGATGNLTLAPLLIAEGVGPRGSDVLIAMRGNAGAGDVVRTVEDASIGADHEWTLATDLGFRVHDLVVVGNPDHTDCLLQQVKAMPGDRSVELEAAASARYYTPSVQRGAVTTTLGAVKTAGGNQGYMAALGTLGPTGTGAGSNVQFYMLGIDERANLHRYDLLKLAGATEADNDLILADGVLAFRAIYGIDSNDDGVLDAWVSPQQASGEDYTLSELTSPTNAARLDRLRRIMALRIALVVRSPIREKELVAPESLTLFQGYDTLEEDFELTEANTGLDDDDARHYRHRVYEATIPLRNALLATDPRF